MSGSSDERPSDSRWSLFPRRPAAVVVSAVGLAVAAAALVVVVRLFLPGADAAVEAVFYPLFSLRRPAAAVLVASGWVALAAVAAGRDGGLVGSLVVPFGPFLGGNAAVFLLDDRCCGHAFGATLADPGVTLHATLTNLGLAAVAALSYALTFGTAGFVLVVAAVELLSRRRGSAPAR